MRKVLLGGVVAIGAVLLATGSAGAGLAPQMVATPNPATVGSQFTVSNVAGAANTCEDGGEVVIGIFDAVTDEMVADDVVTPDEAGNWTITGTASDVGEYVIEASCLGEELPANSPQASPDFDYASLPFSVVAAPITTTTTEAAVPTTPTSAAPAVAAVATPAFTG